MGEDKQDRGPVVAGDRGEIFCGVDPNGLERKHRSHPLTGDDAMEASLHDLIPVLHGSADEETIPALVENLELAPCDQIDVGTDLQH